MAILTVALQCCVKQKMKRAKPIDTSIPLHVIITFKGRYARPLSNGIIAYTLQFGKDTFCIHCGVSGFHTMEYLDTVYYSAHLSKNP